MGGGIKGGGTGGHWAQGGGHWGSRGSKVGVLGGFLGSGFTEPGGGALGESGFKSRGFGGGQKARSLGVTGRGGGGAGEAAGRFMKGVTWRFFFGRGWRRDLAIAILL